MWFSTPSAHFAAHIQTSCLLLF